MSSLSLVSPVNLIYPALDLLPLRLSLLPLLPLPDLELPLDELPCFDPALFEALELDLPLFFVSVFIWHIFLLDVP